LIERLEMGINYKKLADDILAGAVPRASHKDLGKLFKKLGFATITRDKAHEFRRFSVGKDSYVHTRHQEIGDIVLQNGELTEYKWGEIKSILERLVKKEPEVLANLEKSVDESWVAGFETGSQEFAL